ncbi:hypothetical protein, partial [Paenibacillus thiaminolyticus]
PWGGPGCPGTPRPCGSYRRRREAGLVRGWTAIRTERRARAGQEGEGAARTEVMRYGVASLAELYMMDAGPGTPEIGGPVLSFHRRIVCYYESKM